LKSTVIKRSVYVGGRTTSVSLEDEFWQALREIANRSNMPMGMLLSQIDGERTTLNLSSATRVFVLNYFREQRYRQSAESPPSPPNSSAATRAR